MAGEEQKRTNPFISYVEPNAIVPPETYEKCGLYGLLYTAIANDLVAQGFEDNLTLNIHVDRKIKEYVKVMEKLISGTPLTLKDKEIEKNVREYIKFYMPIDEPFLPSGVVNFDTQAANLKYIQEFQKNFDNMKSVVDDIVTYAEANGIKLTYGMLSRDQFRLLLNAKRAKTREFYDMVRNNCDGKPGKTDKEGASKQGVHLRLYEEGKNIRLKKKLELRRESRWNWAKVLGSVALWGAFGAGILFTGGALSPTLAGLLGPGLAASGLGQIAVGLISLPISFRLAKKLTGKAIAGVTANRKRKREYKDFMGPKITRERLEALLSNYGKETKDLTFNERKALLMFDKAAKSYFEKGKVTGTFEGEDLNKYLPQWLIEKYNYETDMKRFKYVSDKNMPFERLKKKYPNQPTAAVGEGKVGKTDALGFIQRDIKGNTIKSLVDAVDNIEHYKDIISQPNADKYMEEIGVKLNGAFDNAIFGQPYTSTSFDGINDNFNDERVKKALKAAGLSHAETMIENSLKFYESIKDGASSPLKADIGVGLKHQLVYSTNSMVEACKNIPGITLTPAEISDIDAVATKIVNIKHEADLSSVSADIDAIPNTKAKDYLKFMFGKKAKTARVNDSEISGLSYCPPAVQNAIKSLEDKNGKTVFGNKSVEDIKNQILADATMSDVQKQAVIAVLNRQVSAVDQERKNKSYEAAVNLYTSGDATKPMSYTDTKAKIAKLTLPLLEKGGDIADGQTVQEFFINKIMKGPMSAFALTKFQDRAYALLSSEASDNKYKNSDETTIEHVCNYLQTVTQSAGYGYISESQKNQLIALMEPNIKNAIDFMLTETKKEFLTRDYSTDKFYKLITTSYGVKGLKEYLSSKTTTSEELKAKLEYMANAGSLHTMLENDYSLKNVKFCTEEARAFALVYFDSDRDSTDPLYQAILRMKGYCQAHNKEDFDNKELPTGLAADDPRNFIQRMRDEVSYISTTGELNPQEKYAALLIAKKRCMAMYKSYIINFFGREMSTETFAAKSTTEANTLLDERFVNRWSALANEIDAAYSGLGLSTAPFSSMKTAISQNTEKDIVYTYSKNEMIEKS